MNPASATKRSPAISPSRAKQPKTPTQFAEQEEGVVIKRSSQQNKDSQPAPPVNSRRVLPSALLAGNPSPSPPPPPASAKKTPLQQQRTPLAESSPNFRSPLTAESGSSPLLLPSLSPQSVTKSGSSRKVTPASRQKVSSATKTVVDVNPFALVDESDKENSNEGLLSAMKSGTKSRRQSVALSVAAGAAVDEIGSPIGAAPMSSAKKIIPKFNSPKRSTSPYSNRLFSQPDSEQTGNVLESVSELVSYTTNSAGRFGIGTVCTFLAITYLYPARRLLGLWYGSESVDAFMSKKGLNFVERINKWAIGKQYYENFFDRTCMSIVLGMITATFLYYIYWRSKQMKEANAIFDLFNQIIIAKLKDDQDSKKKNGSSEYEYVPVEDIRQHCIDLVGTAELNEAVAQCDPSKERNLSRLATQDKIREHWAFLEEQINKDIDSIICDVVTSSDYTAKRSWKYNPEKA